MSRKLLKENKPLFALCVVSLAVLPSLFMGPKVMGIVFLVYMAVIAWCIVSFFGLDFFKNTYTESANQEDGKSRPKVGYSYFLVPIVFFGILMALVQLFLLIFIL